MFEQTFKNIDAVLRKEAGCSSELDYTEQTSWMLFLKYLDDLERELAMEAELVGKSHEFLFDVPHRWSSWAAPKQQDGSFDHDSAKIGDDLIEFVNDDLFPYLENFRERANGPDTIQYKIGAIFGEVKSKFQSGYSLSEALAQMEAKDVSIKGANAVDPDGNIGVFAGDGAGGTVGGIWGTLTARGCHWISPVSLERLIPSVIDAHFATGNHLWDLTMGSSAGMMPVVTAKAVTEIQALEILTGVTAVHIASGGVAGSEGAVMLALEGDKQTVTEAFELCESVKDEPQIPDPRIVDAVREPEEAPKR